ncbi:MAG: preprotein translocase subunit SecA, partial [Bacteroidota bacterium]
MLGFLKNFIGTKQDRDLKQYQALVLEINKNFESFQSLSSDELRSKTLEFRERISDYLSEIDAEIASVTEKAVSSEDFNEKDELFKEVDELRKNRDKALEDVLRQILPEAFAVVKEAGRRFTQNEVIEVTATDHDRMLASKPGKTYVSIQGDKAIWKNKWTAAGGEITWNMIHYDVQLIGGM